MRGYAVRPDFEAGESLLGYIHRLAAANQLGSASLVASDIRAQNFSRGLSRNECQRLSILCDTDRELLYQSQPIHLPRDRARIFAVVLPADVIEWDLLRFCPLCLSQTGIDHLIWDIKLISSCPIHGLTLVNRCPECDTPLPKAAPNIFRCQNLHDIRLPPILPNPENSESVRVAAMFYRKCAIGTGLRKLRLPAYLKGRDIASYVREIALLGKLRFRIVDQSASNQKASVESLFYEGHYYLRDWPRRFVKDLFTFERTAAFPINPTLLSWLRVTLAIALEEGLGDWIVTVIRQHLNSKGYLLLPGTFGRFDRSNQDTVICLAEASNLMRISQLAIRLVARHEQWPGQKGLDFPEFFGLRASDITKWVQNQGVALSVDEVAKHFGCCSSSIENLVKLGSFGEAARTRYLEQQRCGFLTAAEEELLKSQIRRHSKKPSV